MRTFEEIKKDLDHAVSTNDGEALLLYSTELDALATPQAEAEASSTRGRVHYLRSDYPAALEHYHRALAIYEELGNRSGVAHVTGNIGNVYNRTGDSPAALEHYRGALALYEELDDGSGVARVMGNIGNALGDIGDYPAALEYYDRALALYEVLSDRSGVARVTCNIGIVYGKTGDYPAALEYYDRALALDEELGNRRGVAGDICCIGNVHHITGDYPAALEYFHRALALYEELGDRSGVALTTDNIGIVRQITGDYSAALEHYHRALSLYEELGERSGVAGTTSGIVSVYLDIGSDTEARALMKTFDSMQIDDPGMRAHREQNRAELQVLDGDFEGAALTLQRALTVALEHGLRSQAADIHKALRELALKQSDLASYVEHNNEFARITEEINGKDTTTRLAIQAKQREIDAERKETEKQLAVLHSTLPKHIADRVARGEVVNDHYDNASVMFIDIVGFTTLSSELTSQQVTTLLDQVFGICDEACTKSNTTRIKTIGDSYLTVSFP